MDVVNVRAVAQVGVCQNKPLLGLKRCVTTTVVLVPNNYGVRDTTDITIPKAARVARQPVFYLTTKL